MDRLALLLATWSVQMAAVVGFAAVGGRVLRLPRAAERLTYWRVVLALAVVLPLGSWLEVPTPVVASGAITVVRDAMASADSAAVGGWSLLHAVAVLWMGGAAARLAWLGIGLQHLGRLRRESRPADVDADVDRLRREIAPHAVLATHPRIAQPVSFGLTCPVVLLPATLSTLADPVRHAVVAHELLHVSRRDWLSQMSEEVVRSVFWFHPAVRYVVARIQLSREELVDHLALGPATDRRAYMEALMSFAQQTLTPVGSVPFARSRHLRRRLTTLACRNGAGRPRPWFLLPALTLVLAAGLTTALTVAGFAQENRRIYTPDDEGVTVPTVIDKVQPSYSQTARENKVQGIVRLEIVVQTDGSVTDTRVTQAVDPDLDQAAIDAVEQWVFEPGTRNGEPVPIRIEIVINFTLQ